VLNLGSYVTEVPQFANVLDVPVETFTSEKLSYPLSDADFFKVSTNSPELIAFKTVDCVAISFSELRWVHWLSDVHVTGGSCT
jgi:hypothetical protein